MNSFKKFLPLLFIFSLWFIFASPYLLHHKVPFPSTYAVNFFPPWSAYHLYDGPVKNNAMPDIITQIYPWRYITIEGWKHGQIPLWNPYSFSGTPHLANYQSAVFSPFNLLFFVLPFVDAWSLLILLQPLLAGLFTYLYCRNIRISKPGSLISSIAFMFCGFITTWMDYGTLGYAILFLPLALFAIEKFLQTNKSRYLILLSLTIPLSFFSGHFQISLYVFLFILLYIGYKGISSFYSKHHPGEGTKRKILTTFYLLLSTIFGLLLAMPQILPSLEFYQQSLRSSLFQQIEAIPLGYLPTLLAPDFFGNPVTRNDWFGHYAEWNGYIGLLPLLLGIYAIARKRTGFVWFLGALGLVILLVACNTPVLSFLVALHVPVLSTSAASRIIVLFSFIFTILAGLGFDRVMEDIRERNFVPLRWWLGGFFLVFLALWGVVLFKLFLPLDKIAIAKQNLKLPTMLFGFVMLIIFLRTLAKNILPLRNRFVIPLICLIIVAFDMLRFVTKWQPFDPKQFVFPSVAVTKNFLAKAPYERVFGDDGAEVSVYNHLPSVEGYDPLYIRRYGEFISSLDGKLSESSRSVITFPKDAIYTPEALQLLDVKYILQKNSDNGHSWGFPFMKYPVNQFTPVYTDGSYTIYKNNQLLTHAFLAQDYIVKTKPQDILHSLFTNRNIEKHIVVLEKDPHIEMGKVQGNVTITSYLPNTITLSAEANKPALLFLSEVYYPGWKAFIDGKETEIYIADYAFRSVIVPAGKHTIVFSYQPISFTVGCWLCIIGIVGICGVGFLSKGKTI